MNEIWKPIKGYEGIYEVSNLGKVRRCGKRDKDITLKGFQGKNKHRFVLLSYGGNKCAKFVHRLVAEAFIPNPNNLKVVRHVDGNNCNDKVDNLKWSSHAEICNTEIHCDRIRRNVSKSVLCFTLDGKLLGRYDSIKHAELCCNVNRGSISRCCRGKLKSAGNYIWKYESGKMKEDKQ